MDAVDRAIDTVAQSLDAPVAPAEHNIDQAIDAVVANPNVLPSAIVLLTSNPRVGETVSVFKWMGLNGVRGTVTNVKNNGFASVQIPGRGIIDIPFLYLTRVGGLSSMVGMGQTAVGGPGASPVAGASAAANAGVASDGSQSQM